MHELFPNSTSGPHVMRCTQYAWSNGEGGVGVFNAGCGAWTRRLPFPALSCGQKQAKTGGRARPPPGGLPAWPGFACRYKPHTVREPTVSLPPPRRARCDGQHCPLPSKDSVHLRTEYIPFFPPPNSAGGLSVGQSSPLAGCWRRLSRLHLAVRTAVHGGSMTPCTPLWPPCCPARAQYT